jgi:TolA-binding protein
MPGISKTLSGLSLIIVCVSAAILAKSATAQESSGIDGAAFAKMSLRALLLTAPAERRGARAMLAEQIGLLPSDQKIAATSSLVARLRSAGARTQNDILVVLADMSSPWETENTESDSDYIYKLVLNAPDDNSRSAADSALANASGLYRDGIAHFNSTNFSDLDLAREKLQRVVSRYPKSQYSDGAAFYYAQSYTKAFVLGDSRGKQLVSDGDAAFESYIKSAEADQIGGKGSFLAAGYYFRGLDAWILGDLTDARAWFNKGLQKFTNDDSIYIYKFLFDGPVIDKFLPAKSLFDQTLRYLKRDPPPTYLQTDDFRLDLKNRS